MVNAYQFLVVAGPNKGRKRGVEVIDSRKIRRVAQEYADKNEGIVYVFKLTHVLFSQRWTGPLPTEEALRRDLRELADTRPDEVKIIVLGPKREHGE